MAKTDDSSGMVRSFDRMVTLEHIVIRWCDTELEIRDRATNKLLLRALCFMNQLETRMYAADGTTPAAKFREYIQEVE